MSVTLSSPLSHYLAGLARADRELTPSGHIERGAACVQYEDLAVLPALRPALEAKLAAVGDSARLRHRLALLLHYLAEVPAEAGTPGQREAAFAVFYFFKGYDLIPDSVPEVGLLDDALLVETVLRRNAAELREHWAARGRVWPENA